MDRLKARKNERIGNLYGLKMEGNLESEIACEKLGSVNGLAGFYVYRSL